MRTVSMDNKIHYIYRVFKSKMKKHGRNIALITDTNYKKTYSWRYLNNFVQKLDGLGISDELIPEVIESLIWHARQNNLLNRGFAILAKSELLNLVVNKLTQHLKDEFRSNQLLLKSHDFLHRHQGQFQMSKYCMLTAKKTKDAYVNMTRWYEQGHISKEYIAVSKVCCQALRSINSDERGRYPKPIDLMKIRFSLLSDSVMADKLKQLLGEDLINDLHK